MLFFKVGKENCDTPARGRELIGEYIKAMLIVAGHAAVVQAGNFLAWRVAG